MKTRMGFVSNSSSSSFAISMDDLTAKQLFLIQNHMEYAKDYGINNDYYDYYDEWIVEYNKETLEASTTMDNFPMDEFLEKIGVKMEKVKWDVIDPYKHVKFCLGDDDGGN